MSEGNTSTGKKWIGLIVLGAIAGILLAPMPGRETRHIIVKEFNDGLRYLSSLGRGTPHEAAHSHR
jgi:hypothetical protein